MTSIGGAQMRTSKPMTRLQRGGIRVALAAALLAATLGVGAPAHAQGQDQDQGQGEQAQQVTNPSRLCGPDDIYVRVTEWRGQEIVRELPIATHGGCVSSWATGQMSIAAVVGQCKRLEDGTIGPGGTYFQLTYPHVFYGIWTAENRADCVRILHGLATGKLDANVLPFPF
jgi:hypothetical protein